LIRCPFQYEVANTEADPRGQASLVRSSSSRYPLTIILQATPAALLPALQDLKRLPYPVWYIATMSHTIKEKDNLLLRAKRIQGQVEALVRALDEERDCSEVLQIMSAARGAMNSLMAEMLEGHIRNHVLNGKHRPSTGQVTAADEVIAMVKSYLK
jgi:DNA-binding FrmR family transcriptional regulator